MQVAAGGQDIDYIPPRRRVAAGIISYRLDVIEGVVGLCPPAPRFVTRSLVVVVYQQPLTSMNCASSQRSKYLIKYHSDINFSWHSPRRWNVGWEEGRARYFPLDVIDGRRSGMIVWCREEPSWTAGDMRAGSNALSRSHRNISPSSRNIPSSLAGSAVRFRRVQISLVDAPPNSVSVDLGKG